MKSNLTEICAKIQKEIDYFGMYTVKPQNSYCFEIHTTSGYITATLIEEIEYMGYPLLHVMTDNGHVIARFTYGD